jgi:hypothetical protein
MNSLEELNNYVSNLTLTFEDQRSPNVIFLPSAAVNQNQAVDKGFSIAAAVGTNIVEVINTDLADPYYEINLSGVPNATLTWATLPSGVVATTPSSGVYRLDGIISDTIWNQIKAPTIQTSVNSSGLYSYTSTIGYFAGTQGNLTKTWTTNLLINNVLFLTTPIEYVYNVSETAQIIGTPQIVNVDSSYPSAVWTVTATPSSIGGISTFTSAGSGGSFSVNGSTKVITISGTRAQVNSHLANITMTATSVAVDFSMTYSASQSINGTTDQVIQVIKSLGLLFLAEPTSPTLYFQEDGPEFSLSGVPLITDAAFNGLGDYDYTITPSNVNAVQFISSIEESLPGTYNSTTKSLTLTGTRAVINSALTNLRIRTRTVTDFADDFTVSYTVVTPRDSTATKIQLLLANTNDTEVTNMAVSRGYVQNNSGLLFTSQIPFISDLDANPVTYTISFSSPIGLFGFGNNIPVSNLSFSGTKSQCNSQFSQVRFWPNKGVNTNSTFTYIQQKDSVTQLTQTSALIGTSGTFAEEFVTLTASTTWTPSYAQLRYASNYDAVLVGGGGGGAYGGGGAGGITTLTNIAITNQTYNIVVGGGGAAAPTNYPQPGSGNWTFVGLTGGTTSAFGSNAGGGSGGTRNFIAPSTFVINGGSCPQGFAGGTGAWSSDPAVRAGGGGAGTNGAGGNGVINTSTRTATRGAGGTGRTVYGQAMGFGGAGGLLRVATNGTITNTAGDQGSGYGGGGGGAQGSYTPTSSVPTPGRAGVVIIRII